MCERLPDLVAVEVEGGHGAARDAFGNDLKESFVGGGAAELAGGEVWGSLPSFAVESVAGGALGLVDFRSGSTVVVGSEGIGNAGGTFLLCGKEGDEQQRGQGMEAHGF